jgi:hypothetical protein
MNCPTCDMPMVWSIELERRRCAVYGDHTRTLPHHPVIAAILDHEDGKTAPNLRLVAS